MNDLAKYIKPCPSSPNCVSTLAKDRQHGIAPIAFSGSADAAMARVLTIVRALPRTTIIESAGNLLRVEFRTLMLRFVDDVSFLVDPKAHVIHFRSASRIGRSDFGVNRKRMEEIRARFETSENA